MKAVRYIILIIVISLSCATPPEKKVQIVKKEIFRSENLTRLQNFFKRSELDSIRAKNVIEKHRIIQHLSHLKKMDNGKRKYYLLEKENITEMIRSVTEGIYLDYILINKHGEIVYTKNNDELFGTNVNEGFNPPLKKCFLNRDGVFFEDVSFILPSSKVYGLQISCPVVVEKEFHGTLILQVEINKINEILDSGTEIFSRDGIIRVTPFSERIFLKYSGFENILNSGFENNNPVIVNLPAGKVIFSGFNYKEITWILAQKSG
jgi:hypothetical protein